MVQGIWAMPNSDKPWELRPAAAAEIVRAGPLQPAECYDDKYMNRPTRVVDPRLLAVSQDWRARPAEPKLQQISHFVIMGILRLPVRRATEQIDAGSASYVLDAGFRVCRPSPRFHCEHRVLDDSVGVKAETL